VNDWQPVLGVLFGAALLLIASAWLWGPPAWNALRRARIRAQPFPQPWREVLRRRMPAFARLPPDVQLRLKKLAQVLIAEKPFIGCAGLQVSDEMRVLVSVQAALLLLRRGAGYYPRLRRVLIYPGAFVVERSTGDGAGLVHDERRALAGESWQQGQVLLSWSDVLDGAADPHDGRNVVIHEFAHQLDQETGPANGAPWLADVRQRATWAQVLELEFRALQSRLEQGATGLIESYAATNAAEFFAVVSELFFERPSELAAAHCALYAQFKGFYGVDPVAWKASTSWLPMEAES
jgi:MtfA peptidase